MDLTGDSVISPHMTMNAGISTGGETEEYFREITLAEERRTGGQVKKNAMTAVGF